MKNGFQYLFILTVMALYVKNGKGNLVTLYKIEVLENLHFHVEVTPLILLIRKVLINFDEIQNVVDF